MIICASSWYLMHRYARFSSSDVQSRYLTVPTFVFWGINKPASGMSFEISSPSSRTNPSSIIASLFHPSMYIHSPLWCWPWQECIIYLFAAYMQEPIMKWRYQGSVPGRGNKFASRRLPNPDFRYLFPAMTTNFLQPPSIHIRTLTAPASSLNDTQGSFSRG
jgi:hypothetical protein